MASPVLSKITSIFKNDQPDHQSTTQQSPKQPTAQKPLRPQKSGQEQLCEEFAKSLTPRIRNVLRLLLISEGGVSLLKKTLLGDGPSVLTEADRRSGLARQGKTISLFRELGADVKGFHEPVDLSPVLRTTKS